MADWKNNLGDFFRESEKPNTPEETSEIGRFIVNVAVPAFEEISREMSRYDRMASIRQTESSVSITVYKLGEEEFAYRITARTLPTRIVPAAEIRFRERKGRKLVTVENLIRTGWTDYSMADITKDDVIEDFIRHYTHRVEQ